MIRKPLLALVAGCLAAPAVPQEIVYADIPQVRQVICDGGKGTAFRVGSGAFVTARHVITAPGCAIDGEPVEVTWESAELDMATLRTKVYGKGLPIDCGGFRDGQVVAGVGYARGLPIQQVVFVTFDAEVDSKLARWGRFRTLSGDRFIPGQSGGAVFTEEGRVVGLVNGFNLTLPISYSQELKDSPLCK